MHQKVIFYFNWKLKHDTYTDFKKNNLRRVILSQLDESCNPRRGQRSIYFHQENVAGVFTAQGPCTQAETNYYEIHTNGNKIKDSRNTRTPKANTWLRILQEWLVDGMNGHSYLISTEAARRTEISFWYVSRKDIAL